MVSPLCRTDISDDGGFWSEDPDPKDPDAFALFRDKSSRGVGEEIDQTENRLDRIDFFDQKNESTPYFIFGLLLLFHWKRLLSGYNQ